jgi:hypothetical protein
VSALVVGAYSYGSLLSWAVLGRGTLFSKGDIRQTETRWLREERAALCAAADNGMQRYVRQIRIRSLLLRLTTPAAAGVMGIMGFNNALAGGCTDRMFVTLRRS